MTEICCEHCLNEFETESDSNEPVICPYCRNWTSLEFKDAEEEITHNWS